MAEELQLALLGNLDIRRSGVPLADLRSGKAQALLCYLAVTGRPHLRPALVGLLWGEMPEANGRSNLSKALTYLRQSVGDHVRITRRDVAFDRRCPHWLDVAAFEANVATDAAAATSDGAQPDVERLARAMELYRGDFLEGFYVNQAPGFEEWALGQQARLRELALQALHALAAYHVGRGEPGRRQAVRVIRRLLALEPWREGAHRQLMTLLARTGQRGAALAQYEACREVLAQELGVEPGVETTRLYERIRDGALGPGSPKLDDRTASSAEPLAAPLFLFADPSPPDVPARFVARQPELAQLGEHLTRALQGQGQVVFVTGEAGTGKTALVAEFARRAQLKHADLIAAGGNCNAFTGAGDPYLPFREILAQLTGDVESGFATGAISSAGARRLWNLMPLASQLLVDRGPGLIDALLSPSRLAERVAAAAPEGAAWREQLEATMAAGGPGGMPLRRADLQAQYADVLRRLTLHHPLLLVVDDLQWADVNSIELLFHLGRRLADSRALIAGIYRPAEVALGRGGRRHPLAPAIHEFERQFGSMEVSLPQAGDRHFVESYLDSEPNRLGHGFREALYRRTRGHALCTVEMLRAMQERGDLVQDGVGLWVEGPSADWASLPAQCEGVIAERIDRLPPGLRRILKVASVEGETFTAEVVAQVLGAAEYEIVTQLSGELDQRHRLVVSEGSPSSSPGGRRLSRYRFRHVLFQEYLYQDLGDAERTYLHEAVGDALAQLHVGRAAAIAVQLAYHYGAAGRLDAAVGYYLQAAEQAAELYARPEARQHYDRALEILAQLPDTVENRRLRVDTLLARIYCAARAESVGTSPATLARADRLVRELPGPDGRPGGDRRRLAEVRLAMGRVHYMRGGFRQAIACYEQVLSLARELDSEELIARSSLAIGQALIMQGRHGRAALVLGEAIPLLERMGSWSEWCRAVSAHGGALVVGGDYAGGLAEIRRARARATDMNSLSEVINNNYHLDVAYTMGGDVRRAMEVCRQTVELAEQAGDRVGLYVGYFHQSWAALRAGLYEAAAAHAAAAEAVAGEIGQSLPHAHNLAAFKAEIASAMGLPEEALAIAQEAVSIAQRMGGIVAEARARRAWGQALAALAPPRWDEAETQLALSVRGFEEGGSRLEAGRTQEAWGRVCRDRGDVAGARAHWERAAAQWEASGLTHELERTRELIDSLGQD